MLEQRENVKINLVWPNIKVQKFKPRHGQTSGESYYKSCNLTEVNLAVSLQDLCQKSSEWKNSNMDSGF